MGCAFIAKIVLKSQMAVHGFFTGQLGLHFSKYFIVSTTTLFRTLHATCNEHPEDL